MASSTRRTSLLPLGHRDDVFFVIHLIGFPPSIDGVGTDKGAAGVSLGRISRHIAILAGHGRNIVGLLLGLLKAEYPRGETPHQATTFINQFMAVKGDFPEGDFPIGEFQALG